MTLAAWAFLGIVLGVILDAAGVPFAWTLIIAAAVICVGAAIIDDSEEA